MSRSLVYGSQRGLNSLQVLQKANYLAFLFAFIFWQQSYLLADFLDLLATIVGFRKPFQFFEDGHHWNFSQLHTVVLRFRALWRRVFFCNFPNVYLEELRVNWAFLHSGLGLQLPRFLVKIDFFPHFILIDNW